MAKLSTTGAIFQWNCLRGWGWGGGGCPEGLPLCYSLEVGPLQLCCSVSFFPSIFLSFFLSFIHVSHYVPSGSLADPLFSVRRNVSTARHQPLIELPSTFSGIWFYRVFLRIEFRFQAVPGALDSVLLGFTGFSGTLMSVPV